jgi:hypothetical protein
VCALYRLHVVRAGFEQVGESSIYITTPSRLKSPVLTLAQALAVPDREAPKPAELSPLNKELLEVFLRDTALIYGGHGQLPETSLDSIKDLLAKGASLVSSTVLHYLSAMNSMAVFTQLLPLLPPGGASVAVNSCVMIRPNWPNASNATHTHTHKHTPHIHLPRKKSLSSLVSLTAPTHFFSLE